MQFSCGEEAAAAPDEAKEVPTTSGDALRLAIKLAVDAGEYERAAALLDLLRGGARRRSADGC